MGAEWRRGQMNAWLLKKKSGTSIVRVRQYNKRFFTLDFDSRVFFYAHAENSKKVSSVIPFSDILDVQLPESHADKGDNMSECSRTSKVSLFRRLSSFGANKDTEQEQHILTVRTRPSRTMELVCSTSFEALQWFEALKAAIAEGAQSQEDTDDAGTAAGDAAEAGPTADPATSAGGARGFGDDLSEESPGSSPPKPARGTFLDLRTEAEDKPSATSGSAANGTATAGESTAVVAAGSAAMQARDFGFGADDTEDSDSAAGSDTEPAGGRQSGRGREDGHVEMPISASAVPAAAARTSGTSYGDKHEGLSMQERLANMQFSDDEDDGDDDDPLGLKAQKANGG